MELEADLILLKALIQIIIILILCQFVHRSHLEAHMTNINNAVVNNVVDHPDADIPGPGSYNLSSLIGKEGKIIHSF